MVSEERQMWHCFGCQKGGDAFSFLMEMEGVDFKEALRILAEKTGVELPRFSGNDQGGTKDRSYEILEWATKFYEKQLWDGAGKTRALGYLRDRGLKDETIRTFRLGYAPPGWRNLHDFLVGRGYTSSELEKAGLVIRKENGQGYYDRFRDRIMFPVMDVLGRVIGYSARVTPGGDESQAKYINTPETGVYHKSHVLYGIQLAKQAMKTYDYALIVEGNMDVIASHQAGIRQVVAVSGTALTGEQLTLIKRYTDNIRFFFDMDGAGQRAARRSTELALERGINIWVVSIPDGKDAADIAKEHPEALVAAVSRATPALQYFLDRLLEQYNRNTPDGKRAIAEDYLSLLRFSSHAIDRAYWMRKLAEAVDVEESTLLSVLQKLSESQFHGPSSSTHMPGAAENPAKTHAREALGQEVFRKRSELLRQNILKLMSADESVVPVFLERIEKQYHEFFAQHPLYKMLSGGSESEQKQDISRGYFEGERMLEGITFSDTEERKKYIIQSLEHFFKELDKELQKEALVALERAMRDAAASGDKEREKLLRQEFNRQLTSGQAAPSLPSSDK